MALPSNQSLVKKLQKAQQELAQGDPAKAVKMLEKLLKPLAHNPNILYLMGLAYGKMGRLDKVKQVSLKALKVAPGHHGILCNLANVLFFEGEMQTALNNYQKALAIKPGDPKIVESYCKVLNRLGRQTEVIELLDKLLLKHPNYARAFVTKGIAYAETGQPEKAVQAFEAALEIEPLLVDANLGMGNMCRFKGDIVKADQYYRAVLGVDSSHALAHIGLATIKRMTGGHDAALEIINKADELVPNHLTILTTKADILEHAGKFEEAFESLQQLKNRGQLTALGVTSFANLCHRFDTCDEAIELLEKTIRLPTTNNLEKQMLYFVSGKLFDKLARYDEAFEHYQLANTCVETDFDEKKDLILSDEYINTYTAVLMKQYPRSTIASSRPIFILGMPRSGTSLTEQVLAAHPDVYGAGELGDITYIAKEIMQLETEYKNGLENWMAKLPVKTMNYYATQYLGSLASLNSTERRITDKMPHNFMYIGLITLLFPEARIIHCTRDPLDNILSIYFQQFSGTHKYASNLKNIALYYNAYLRLMKHWGEVVDIPILTVNYEDMVGQQEITTRRLLEFCELEWNDDVLQFHKTKRSVGTASYEQVRQPMYKTSKGRWKNYEKYLKEVKTIINAS